MNNADIKDTGGAIGLTQDPLALCRWCIGGPEISRIISEFHAKSSSESIDSHHEETTSAQTRFMTNCTALKESFLQAENPFKLCSKELA